MISRILYYSSHPSEIAHLIKMKKEFGQYRPNDKRLSDQANALTDKDFCYEALKKVSRSFAVVIQQLPSELQDPVCLFYLILRGLDTIEDDMSIPENEKKELLQSFASKLNDKPFNYENIGDTDDYRDLMLHFDKVCKQYQRLDESYQTVITEITDKMAAGMNEYASKNVVSYEDWNDYCHYVAGLVGIGLSQLFIASGLENSNKLKDENLSNEMGLFLQKTNIIRDFAEDLHQSRIFWPEEAWKKRVEKLGDLQKYPGKGLNVLNELVENALEHIPQCLSYLKEIRNEQVFRFCAIPQLMAIATLGELFNNESVLYENVKIRKGRTAKYFMSVYDFEQTKKEFESILVGINTKNNSQITEKILDII